MKLTNIKEKYQHNVKKNQLLNNIDNIKVKNKKIIEKEFKRTVKDLSKNSVKITEKNKTGEIKLSVTTNKRTLGISAGLLALNIATLSLLVNKVKKPKKVEVPESKISYFKKSFSK